LDLLRRLELRDIFAARTSHVFAVISLPHLKLRALASVCLRRLGRSTLADVFARGENPYEYAAAQLASMSLSQFAALKDQNPVTYRQWIDVGQSLLSSAPLGLSMDRVLDIILSAASDPVSRAQAARWYRQLIEEVYSELAEYLRDDTLDVLAENFHNDTEKINKALEVCFDQIPHYAQLRKWYRQYSRITGVYKVCLQAMLEHCCRRRDLRYAPQAGVSDEDLFRAMFTRSTLTPNGRRSGRLLFSQAHAAEYLDLADDAAKLALFTIVSSGYQVAAFTEEAILVEMPVSEDLAAQTAQMQTLISATVQQMLGNVPVQCDVAIRETW
jgi:hypothetical protein